MAWSLPVEGKTSTPPSPPLEPKVFFKPLKEYVLTKGLKVGWWGEPEVGKSYGSLTFPEPVYVVDTELSAKKVAYQHFPDKDIRIAEVKVVDPDSPIDAPDPVGSLDKVEKAIIALKDVKEGTIVIDTMSDYWAWMSAYVEIKAKRFYKKTGEMMRTEWGIANARCNYFIMRLLAMPVHVVLVAQARKVYGPGGEETELLAPKWMYATPHRCDIIIWSRKELQQSGKTKYMSKIIKNRWNRAYDKEIEDLTYPKLAAALTELGIKIEL